MNRTKAARVTDIVMSVFKLNGYLLEWGNQFSSRHGLTSSRWQVLGVITIAQHPLSIPQIATAMGNTRQGVLKQINLLIEEGLVESIPNPTHKRSPLYVLSANGRKIYDALEERWQSHARQLGGDFTVADLEATIRVLSAMSKIHADPPPE